MTASTAPETDPIRPAGDLRRAEGPQRLPPRRPAGAAGAQRGTLAGGRGHRLGRLGHRRLRRAAGVAGRHLRRGPGEVRLPPRAGAAPDQRPDDDPLGPGLRPVSAACASFHRGAPGHRLQLRVCRLPVAIACWRRSRRSWASAPGRPTWHIHLETDANVRPCHAPAVRSTPGLQAAERGRARHHLRPPRRGVAGRGGIQWPVASPPDRILPGGAAAPAAWVWIPSRSHTARRRHGAWPGRHRRPDESSGSLPASAGAEPATRCRQWRAARCASTARSRSQPDGR
jgi:hypothetical protein